jgi:hypothetical protein
VNTDPAGVGKFVRDACKKRVGLRAELAQRCEVLFGTSDCADTKEENAEIRTLALPVTA